MWACNDLAGAHVSRTRSLWVNNGLVVRILPPPRSVPSEVGVPWLTEQGE